MGCRPYPALRARCIGDHAATIYAELLGVRSSAGSLLGDRQSMRHADVVVTAGWLSALLAISATDLGDHAAALVWCSDTEQRGNDARHPELAGWAVLVRALIAYYQGRATRSAAMPPTGSTSRRPDGVHEARARRCAAAQCWATRLAWPSRRKATAAAGAPRPASPQPAPSPPARGRPAYTATSLLLVSRYQEAAEVTRRIIDGV